MIPPLPRSHAGLFFAGLEPRPKGVAGNSGEWIIIARWRWTSLAQLPQARDGCKETARGTRPVVRMVFGPPVKEAEPP